MNSTVPTEPPPGAPTPLAESGWFWLLMFSAVALLGILAVTPKYVRRQARAEQRYANRVQTWQAQQSRGAAENLAQTDDAAVGQTMESQPPRASLLPLAALTAAVMAVSAAGLLVSRRRSG